MLRDLLDDLKNQDTPFTLKICHDGPIRAGYNRTEVTEIIPHHGKRRFFQFFNKIVKSLPDADLYLFLPDDILIDAGGIDKLVAEWNAINDPNKALYNCLIDKGRTGLPNWTRRYAEPYNLNSLRTYWWDLCGFITPGFISILKRKPVSIHSNRWRQNPRLGSGVGEYISRLAIEEKTIYQTRNGYIKHIGEKSEMNKISRKNEPLESWDSEPIIAGMATIRGRENQAMMAMASIANQVDRLYVVFNKCEPNEYAKKHPKIFPIIGDNQIGDGEKFRGLDICKKEIGSFYFLSVDDDIIYPDGYAWRMVHKIEEFKRYCVCTVHGKTIPRDTPKFYGGHTAMHHTKSELLTDKIVNCVGSGTAAFHTDTLEFGTDYIKAPNMADIWLSKACHDQDRNIVAIQRPEGWLKVQHVSNTIYDKHHRNGKLQTKYWNEIFK